MRIGTDFARQQAIEGIAERQTRLVETQRQVGTGLRVGRPSDDPAAAAQAERLRSREVRIEAELRVTGHARHMLSNADTALADGATALQSARDTLLAAGNGTATLADRATHAVQLREARDRLLAVANRGDGTGGYLFGGQGTSAAPVATTGTAYAPQAGTIEVGAEMRNPVSFDGRENFVAIRGPAGTESIFARLDAAIAVLEDPGAPAATVGTTVRGVIDSVDRAMERLSTTRTLVGERLRAIDVHVQALESGSIAAQGRLSELVDVDMVRGLSTLAQQQQGYEAALQSYAKIARLSLFDFV
jgi:flagellar hook-associated protein 3 FlgL